MEPAAQQPPNIEIYTTDGLFVKQMYIAEAGTFIPQHSHAYEHLSMLAVGSVRLWKDGELVGDFHAPCGITIEAEAKHLFQSIEPGTMIYCIHNIERAGQVEIVEEHQLIGGR